MQDPADAAGRNRTTELTLVECRELLGVDASVHDADIRQLRDSLSVLAHFAITQLERQPESLVTSRFALLMMEIPVDGQEFLLERAAIREVDGGMTRLDAERGAVEDYTRSKDVQ